MSNNKKKILAICGSVREKSSNLSLLKAIKDLFSDSFEMEIFQGLLQIPPFNLDIDNENPPKEISDFRNSLSETDGILICTPEYAMGVPGVLKNALDWTVSSTDFSHKPVALITASTSGEKAHQSLLETLKVIESDIPESSQLLISFVKTKAKDDKIIDAQTLERVEKTVNSLIETIERRQN